MARRKRPTGWDARAETAWKWLLRLSALAAFFYILIFRGGDVPLGVFVLIGGMAGLPNVLSLQQALNKSSESGDEESE
jgi:hypothetical protein